MARPFDSPQSNGRRIPERAVRSSAAPAGVLLSAALLLAPAALYGNEPAEMDGPAHVSDATGSFWAQPDSRDEPLDVRFQSLTLGGALRFVTMDRLNVIVPEAIDRKISLDLRGVSEGEALDHLLVRENLGARFEGNTVFLSAMERRAYEVPLVLKSEVAVWEDIESALSTLASTEGKVAVSRGGSLLSVEDAPENLARIEAHLNDILRAVLRQVEIEVKIMEVVFSDEEGGGIDWSLFGGVLDPEWGVTGGTVGGAVGFQSVADQRQLFQVGVLKPGKWQAFLDAFDEEITLNLIASPRLTALPNETAEFRVKERIPYLTKTVTTDQGVTTTEFQLAFDEAGIQVDLVASASEGGLVTLQVNPKVSSVTGFTQSLPDLGAQPIIDLRESKSTVRLPEGHSLVMSGLMQDRENVTVTGVPLLSKVPVLGALFRAERRLTEKTELVVVLTPRLRREPAVGTLARYDRVRAVPVDVRTDYASEEVAEYRSERAWDGFLSGDRGRTLSLAQAAVRAHPSAWWAINNLGLAQREMGLVALSEKTLRQASRAESPAPVPALVNLGTVLVHRGKAAEAVPVLREAAERASNRAVRGEATLALALALELDGRPAESLASLDGMDTSDPVFGSRVAVRRSRLGPTQISMAQ